METVTKDANINHPVKCQSGRGIARCTTPEDLEEMDRHYWDTKEPWEKIQMVTLLRECMYGTIATTGQFPRFYTMSKR